MHISSTNFIIISRNAFASFFSYILCLLTEEEEEEQQMTEPSLPTNLSALSATATTIPTATDTETLREAPIQPPQPQTTPS